ncbi:hypothetical protein WMF26_38610 [Sorangium sp. So ce185]|uniref:hypothetical protein n=1 Tax=Sorangium sp. So ce185 TaxID=3133287 RepID=UPI003F63863E
MNQLARHAFSASLAAASVGLAGTAHADVTVSGEVAPGAVDPSDPWDLGPNALVIGGASTPMEPTSGEVIVSRRGTLISAGAAVAAGVGSGGTVQVVGYGSRWINNGQLALSLRTESRGSLLVQRGAQVTTYDLTLGGGGYLAEGYVLVEGYDASLRCTSANIGHAEGISYVEIKQGGSFFSNNAYIATCPVCEGQVTVTGSATRWVNTGVFNLGANGHGTLLVEQGAQVFTAGARIETYASSPLYASSSAIVRGWDATWTNEGLLRVGRVGYGELTIGAYGSLVTEDTEIRSEFGGGFVRVNEPYASWRNSGDVTVFASWATSPSLLIERRGQVSIGGLLRTAPLREGAEPGPGPVVRLVRGELDAGAIEVEEGDFDFAGGRLSTGSFVGDLVNAQAGELSVGEAYPSTGVAGDYRQGPSAALRIAVASPGAAPLLEVDGDVGLGGVLEVVPADDAASFQAGDTIALLGWSGELTGTFAEVSIALPLAPGLAWDTSALYTTGEITAVAAP